MTHVDTEDKERQFAELAHEHYELKRRVEYELEPTISLLRASLRKIKKIVVPGFWQTVRGWDWKPALASDRFNKRGRIFRVRREISCTEEMSEGRVLPPVED